MNTENLTIRTAHQNDLPAVLSLLQELEFGAESPMSLKEAQQLFCKIASYPDYSIYLAETDGEPVGTYALLIMDKLEHGGAPSGIVDSVAVAAKHQGCGIGSAMMLHAKEVCKSKGCYKLMLSSNKHRIQAHQFYEKLGFEQHGYSYSIEV